MESVMASLLTLHHSPSLSFSPRTLLFPPKRHRFRAQISVNAAAKTGAAVVWLKHDLRVDDHPALLAAADHSGAIPLYVFDHRILSRFEDETLEMVVAALEDLRNALRDKGTNLMVRFGKAENVIQEIVEKVRVVSAVYAEEEVEYGLREMVGVVKERLGAMQASAPEFVLWRTPFYDVKSLKGVPDSYNDFTKLRLPITMPLLPATFSSSAMELDWGPMPTFDDLKEFVNANPCKMQESWSSIKVQSKSRDEVFVTTKGKTIGGQTSTVLNSLGAYLRYLDGESRDDFWQKVHERMPYAESRDGASFNTLFGTALSLGILSRRRVYFEAIKHEKERNSGFLSPLGSGATISAAVDSVCSMEWYWLVALKSQISDDRRYQIRIWRWKGYLIQYTVVGHEGPAMLLVHGFGAFLEHYRDNIGHIAEGGNRVWAITVLGFGKSEKPNIVYTELLWSEMVRDFILEVVGEPVHLVGNSIGGYIIAIVACLWPALVNSVVLINSGGEVMPYSSAPFIKERKTSGASWLGAQFLLFYLRFQLKDIVQKCYPNKTERVDNWLIDEMLRASYDPGVAVVLESVFSFNLSLPLNYLLKGFKEEVLIIQGMRDPISNSKSKVAMIKEHCDGFLIKELDAGHCPHDELPDEVNSIICEWIVTLSSKRLVVSFK
uniref:uncharacterized protein LOC101314712 n=1 Tax=Fragaria vesca subsp. vesca TaxID=101020 RepID=UPI0005C9E16B|nr:PREDICTED: uncharacterized protein LOC101314712 [Fragaria vesca subsp. vesca]